MVSCLMSSMCMYVCVYTYIHINGCTCSHSYTHILDVDTFVQRERFASHAAHTRTHKRNTQKHTYTFLCAQKERFASHAAHASTHKHTRTHKPTTQKIHSLSNLTLLCVYRGSALPHRHLPRHKGMTRPCSL
jgi:hypothetical protein